MIPLFPKFKKLELKDKKEIEQFTRQFPPYSDYNFTSMYCYNTEDKMRVSRLNGNLVVRFQDYITGKLFYSFLGKTDSIKTADILLEYVKKKGLKPELKLIPEIVIASDKKIKKTFHVKADRDHFDYIYSVSRLSHLRGKKYYTKLKEARKFYKINRDAHLIKLDLRKENIKKEIVNVFAQWEETRGKIRKETRHEFTALKRFLRNSYSLHSLIIGAYCKDKLIGFSIAEVIHNDYAIHHFIKANFLYKNLFTVLYKKLGEELNSRKINWLNNEQDIGIPGLRHAKKLWRTLFFLKKYRIS